MKIEIDKPVIPQFIADWIEKEKTYSPFHKSFARAINLVNHDKDWSKWEYEVGSHWSRVLATAFLYGYEVEQEPLYYAKIKGWDYLAPSQCFWSYIPEYGEYIVGSKVHSSFHLTELTMEEWNELGINDTNADFEKVEQ